MTLTTRILPPDQKGSKLTFSEMDNNLYYLQSLGVSGLTYSANTLTLSNPTGGTKTVKITENNRWYIPSGQTYTLEPYYQGFVYGDLIVSGGTLNIKENAQLVIINGDLINDGGNIIQSGDTYLIDFPLVDTSIDSFVYSNNTFTITDSTGGTFSTVLNVLTGLTVNGVLSATTISGNTFYGDGSNLTGIKPYKVYTALLTQSSTNPPTSIVLENDLGDIAYTYDGTGLYSISGDTLFTENKTAIFYTQRSGLSTGNIQIYRTDVNNLSIMTSQYTSGSGDFSVADDVLSDTAIEIRVYN